MRDGGPGELRQGQGLGSWDSPVYHLPEIISMEQGGWQEDQYSGGGQMQREWPELRESEGNGKNDVSNNAGHMYASGFCVRQVLGDGEEGVGRREIRYRGNVCLQPQRI